MLAAVPLRHASAGQAERREQIKEDDAGRPIVRAVRLVEPFRVDGALEDPVYRTTPPVTGLIQQVPREGAPSTEKTEIWVLFDERAIYVAARCWESVPPDKWVANELRRDTTQLKQNDTFGVAFDTFFDRRNGFVLYTNPLGARADYAVADEVANFDWNPVWDVRTGRFEQGWTVEMEVPFKSLRYRAGMAQTWGVQFRRTIRRKNEWTYLTRVSAKAAGPAGLTRVSYGGTLLGLDLAAANGNIELKPFAIERLSTDRTAAPVISNDPDGNIGVDVKYGVTPNLTADFTYSVVLSYQSSVFSFAGEIRTEN